VSFVFLWTYMHRTSTIAAAILGRKARVTDKSLKLTAISVVT